MYVIQDVINHLRPAAMQECMRYWIHEDDIGGKDDEREKPQNLQLQVNFWPLRYASYYNKTFRIMECING
jgi:hypothetical protein